MKLNKKKIIGAIPFLVIIILVLYCWVVIISTNYTATSKHYATLVGLIITSVCFFVWYRIAILLTGIILVLATFNLFTFYAVTDTSFIGFNLGDTQITTPEIQWWSLLLLIGYLIINFDNLVEWYFEIKERKKNESVNNKA
jgi:hypothetical protein